MFGCSPVSVAPAAWSLVLEGIPAEVAREVTQAVAIPTFGIGAGPDCDGQVLVVNDLLGIGGPVAPRFVRRYAEMGKAVGEAFAAYAADVRAGRFPSDQESYE